MKTNYRLTSLFLGALFSLGLTAPAFTAGAEPVIPASDEAVLPIADAESSLPAVDQELPGAPAAPQYFFVGLQPPHKLTVQAYLIDALHFAHNSYGFVSWSMRSSRRNLNETLFSEHLSQLEHFITQTIVLAELSISLTPDSAGLPEIKVQLEDLKRAVKLVLEENKDSADAKEPGAKIIESGKIHEQVGKALPILVANLQKALLENASASAQINHNE